MLDTAKKRRLLIGSVVAVFLFFFLFKQIDFDKPYNLKIDFNYNLLSIAFILYFIANVVRAERFNLLFSQRLNFPDIFNITTLYNLYTALFPGGLGEFSFVYLIKKKVRKNIPTGVIAVLVTRIFDVLIISIFAIFSLLSFSDIQFNFVKYFYILLILICSLSLTLIYLPVISKKILKILDFRLRRNNFWKAKLRDNILSFCSIIESNKKKNFFLFLSSTLFWGIIFFMIQLFFWSIGVRLNYFESIFIGTISSIVSIIPLNTLGGFGYKETGLTLGLILLGIIKNNAIAYSFLIHLISLAFVILLVCVGFSVNFIFKYYLKRHTAI